MKKHLRKSFIAGVCALALIGGSTLPLVQDLPMFPQFSMSASAAGSVTFDKTTGCLMLKGAITKSAVQAYANNTAVTAVVSNHAVFPADCSNMFKNFKASSFDLATSDTSKVTNMLGMFSQCTNMTKLKLNTINTGNVTNMQAMFAMCNNLTSLDLKCLNTAKVTNMTGMFTGCSKLTSLDLKNFDTSNVTSMDSMFMLCSNLTFLNLSSFKTTKVTNMYGMFYNCSKLKTIVTTASFSTAKVTSSKSMFFNCTALVGGNGTAFNGTTDKTYARNDKTSQKGFFTQSCCLLAATGATLQLFGNICSEEVRCYVDMRLNSVVASVNTVFPANCRDLFSNFKTLKINLSNADTTKVTDMSNMFADCIMLTSLNISGFNTTNVTNMALMFCGCYKLTSLDVSKFNTAKVTNMNGMFYNCCNLKSLDLSSFNTAKVTNMQEMFQCCSALTSLNLSSFNTANVTTMEGMFEYCHNLTSLDLTKFNTAKVVNTCCMFFCCENLRTIKVSSLWTNAKSSASRSMFNSCTSLVGGNGTKYSYGYIDNTYARIDKAGQAGYFTKG